MNSPEPTAGNRKDPEIAAAELLFQDAELPASTRPVGPVIATGSSEGFELADVSEHSASPPPSSQAAPAREAAGGKPADSRPRARMVAPVAPALERPVRITPEQAARDYFGALSHHFPHYRRMWLLLSARGRTSPQFASYEGFKAYWIARLGQLHEGHAGRFSPLVFQVEEFHAEKSAGKTEIDARFRLRVLVRGRRGEGPIGSMLLERSFVRGPDGMWYLN